MKQLSASVKSHADQLSGGTSGDNNVPNALWQRARDLEWSQNTLNAIETIYQQWLVANGGTVNDGVAVWKSKFAVAEKQMTEDMRKVANRLSSSYTTFTINNFQNLTVTSTSKTPDLSTLGVDSDALTGGRSTATAPRARPRTPPPAAGSRTSAARTTAFPTPAVAEPERRTRTAEPVSSVAARPAARPPPSRGPISRR